MRPSMTAMIDVIDVVGVVRRCSWWINVQKT
jgi:hypothetical protein